MIELLIGLVLVGLALGILIERVLRGKDEN